MAKRSKRYASTLGTPCGTDLFSAINSINDIKTSTVSEYHFMTHSTSENGKIVRLATTRVLFVCVEVSMYTHAKLIYKTRM
jgi:hypothetical protein